MYSEYFSSSQRASRTDERTRMYSQERNLVAPLGIRGVPENRPDFPSQRPSVHLPQSTLSSGERRVSAEAPLHSRLRSSQEEDFERLYFQELSKNRVLRDELACLADVHSALKTKSSHECSQLKQLVAVLESEVAQLKRETQQLRQLESSTLASLDESFQLKSQVEFRARFGESDLLVEEARTKLRKMNDEKIELMRQIGEQNIIISELREQVSTTTVQFNQRRVELEVQIQGLHSQLTTANNDLARLREATWEVETLRQEITRRDSEINRLQTEITVFRANPTVIREQVTQIHHPTFLQITEKDKEIARLRSELSVQAAENARLVNQVAASQVQVSSSPSHWSLTRELETARSEISRLTQEVSLRRSEADSLRSEVEIVRQELGSLRSRPPLIQERVVEREDPNLRRELSEKMFELESLRREVEILRTRVHQAAEKIVQVEPPGLREEMGRIRQERDDLRLKVAHLQAQASQSVQVGLNAHSRRPTERVVTSDDPSLQGLLQQKQLEIERLNRELSSMRASRTTMETVQTSRASLGRCGECARKDVTIDYLNSQIKREIPTYPLEHGTAEHSLTIRCNCRDQRIFKDNQHISISSNCLHMHPNGVVHRNESHLTKDDGLQVTHTRLGPGELVIPAKKELGGPNLFNNHVIEDPHSSADHNDLGHLDSGRITFGNSAVSSERNIYTNLSEDKHQNSSVGRVSLASQSGASQLGQSRSNSVTKSAQIVGITHYGKTGLPLPSGTSQFAKDPSPNQTPPKQPFDSEYFDT